MEYVIREIQNNSKEIENVKKFLYTQIKKEYGIGPTFKYHYDIKNLVKYYILPEKNNFYICLDRGRIIGTCGIRAYDLNFDYFKDQYTKENTASIWRLMVDENYRRCGIAHKLVSTIEEFAKDTRYSQIYLHTHRYLESGLPFWKSCGYKITLEEDDYDETTHMIKEII